MEKHYTLKSLDAHSLFLMVKIIAKIGIKEFAACFERDNLRKLIAQTAASSEPASEDQPAAEREEDPEELDLEEEELDLDDEDPEEEEDLEAAVGYDIFMEILGIVLENIPKCEADLYKLLAHCSDLSARDIKCMPAPEFVTMLGDFVHMPDFPDFIQAALKSFSRRPKEKTPA